MPIVQDKQHSLLFSGYSETEEVQMEQLQKYKQHDSIDTSFIGKVIGAGVNIIWIGCKTAEGSGSQGLKGKQV